MIMSKGLKLQTTNISSGLSTRLFVFRMPSNFKTFKVYLTSKPVIIDSLTALFGGKTLSDILILHQERYLFLFV